MGMMVPMTQLTQFQIKFHLRYGFDFEKKKYEKIATITIKAASVLSFPKKSKKPNCSCQKIPSPNPSS